MAREQQGAKSGKASTKNTDSSKQYAPYLSMIARVLAPAIKEVLLNKMPKTEGAAPEVATIVYVHGIGNKPVASILKCQWDTALFGAPMSDRTRLAYWVNRDRYPTPEPGTCASKDVPLEENAGLGIRSLTNVELQSEPELDRQQQKIMAALERRIRNNVSAERSAGPGAKVLPLPEGLRRWVTQRITERFLKDVRDFLFDEKQRSIMEGTLIERLDVGGGPFIVIGHSQGSMIAYNVLRQLQKINVMFGCS